MLDHGGNLDVAIRRFGGSVDDWIDLSTGINRRPYPVPEFQPRHWTALPSRADLDSLHDAARQAYATSGAVLAVAGAQAAIQLIPSLTPRGRVRVLAPTYEEYRGVLRAADREVEEVSDIDALAGADLAVVVNPNNPDGQRHDPARLLALLSRVGRLIVDESFADAVPGLSLASEAGRAGLLILRSFGKFYGLAGLRLGFVLGCEADVAAFAAMAGPWPVSGAAVEIGRHALMNRDWAARTTVELTCSSERLDSLTCAAGWRLVGGTPLFRLYETSDAKAAQERLGRAHIWSRIFPVVPGWLRLGIPGDETEWVRLAAVLAS